VADLLFESENEWGSYSPGIRMLASDPPSFGKLKPVYNLNSWLRYLVFLLGLAALGYALWGIIGKRPYTKRMWDLSSWFTLSLYLQIVVGFFLVFSTTSRFFDRSLGLHMVLSMVAVVVSQMTYSANRRRPREERSYGIHVWGVGLALALVLAGLLAIRNSIFG
jgi:hypothetical protein